jgi:hypothetical protein
LEDLADPFAVSAPTLYRIALPDFYARATPVEARVMDKALRARAKLFKLRVRQRAKHPAPFVAALQAEITALEEALAQHRRQVHAGAGYRATNERERDAISALLAPTPFSTAAADSAVASAAPPVGAGPQSRSAATSRPETAP